MGRTPDTPSCRVVEVRVAHQEDPTLPRPCLNPKTKPLNPEPPETCFESLAPGTLDFEVLGRSLTYAEIEVRPLQGYFCDETVRTGKPTNHEP